MCLYRLAGTDGNTPPAGQNYKRWHRFDCGRPAERSDGHHLQTTWEAPYSSMNQELRLSTFHCCSHFSYKHWCPLWFKGTNFGECYSLQVSRGASHIKKPKGQIFYNLEIKPHNERERDWYKWDRPKSYPSMEPELNKVRACSVELVDFN